MRPPGWPVGQRFRTILADPAWTFLTRSDGGKGRSPERHYGCLSLDQIKALPVAELAAPDCVLLIWACDPLLPAAMEVLAAWGFEFKTVGFYWMKTNADGSPFVGMGYWTRAGPEQCLLATIGQPRRLSAAVPRLIVAPRREHSRKPDEQYERIEALTEGPYLELFARQQRTGWVSWGDQVDRFGVAA